jgi:hypothetical protein
MLEADQLRKASFAPWSCAEENLVDQLTLMDGEVALEWPSRKEPGLSSASYSAKRPQMMLWTAPTLRHRSAIGWLREANHIEGGPFYGQR